MKLNSITRLAGILGLGCLASVGTMNAADGSPLYFNVDAGMNIIDLGISEVDTDVGFRVDLGLGYKLSSSSSVVVAVELESGFLYNSISDVDANIWQIPVLANVVLTFMPESNWKPYIGVGGGGVYWQIEGGGSSYDEFDGALQALAGIKYKVGQQSEVGLGYKALWVFTDLSGMDSVINHSILLTYTLHM